MSQEKIGTDEWVARYQERAVVATGMQKILDLLSKRLSLWGWLAILAVIALPIPLLTRNDFVIHIGANIALMATLGIGLNLVVGYAGLLDLGFVAFYGIGAYTYAYLSSDFSGWHWNTIPALVLIILVSAVFGVILGLPSLRLIGDYLAIVTLGFGQMFVQLTTSMTRVQLPDLTQINLFGLRPITFPYLLMTLFSMALYIVGLSALLRMLKPRWRTLSLFAGILILVYVLKRVFPLLQDSINLTSGPNGIPNLDSVKLFGFKTTTQTDYYYLLIVTLAIVLVVAYHLNRSRLGRAWRALREDELAAEAMGIPTRRLKLMAFSLGAAIAGFSGAMYAAFQGSVFPSDFDITVLITVYAIIVLGGLGSLPGVVIGAVVMMAIPDILRIPELASVFFYFGVVITLVATLKPRWQSLVILGGVVVLGVLLKVILPGVQGNTLTPTTAPIINIIRVWLIAPQDPTLVGNWAFGLLIVMILLVTRLTVPVWRLLALVPTLYLLAFVWETRLSEEPSITRLIFVGVLLIGLMIYRPNGLLGQRRVEVV